MNTNMRLIALLLVLIFPSWAIAWKLDPDVRLTNLESIHITIDDQASQGCWTNLRESKEYAAGKIEALGSRIEEKFADAEFVFAINVQAQRTGTGSCYGHVEVEIFKVTRLPNGIGGMHVVSSKSGISYNPKNLNYFVLDVIAAGMKDWQLQ